MTPQNIGTFFCKNIGVFQNIRVSELPQFTIDLGRALFVGISDGWDSWVAIPVGGRSVGHVHFSPYFDSSSTLGRHQSTKKPKKRPPEKVLQVAGFDSSPTPVEL